VHRVQIRDALFYHENPRADTGADNRDLNLLEQNLSALLCEQLDTQRTYFESKIEQKREEIKREVTVNSDTKVKELSKLKETLQEELNEKKTQYSFIRKNRVILEQKIENIRRSVQEEETIKENLESHLNYIQSEQEDPTTKALEKDIENQKQLLEGFRKKLDELYQSLG
jgi:DNA repair exonuclease SbcCD ATPase subunit